MVGQLKSSTGMIMNGKEWCRPAQQGLVQKYHIWRCMACNLGGWRAEPSMAIPVVHIAPPGTNAVDARGMAKWLSGGGSMVVSSGTGLYRCTCVHAEFNVGRVRDSGCAV